MTKNPTAIEDAGDEPIVQLQNLTKTFGANYAVDDISLTIYKGEFFSLLGASGCGKSTLLRMLAGFEQPTSGQIFIDGQEISKVPAYKRPINMMFQNYALFPHMNVADNIGFGLKQEGMPQNLRNERIAEMMSLVQIEKFAKRKPHQLSGGQRQRVALARALAKHPKILLLDEPLGALDKKLREKTQFELMNIQNRLGTTFIVVTHDQEEAMTMSSRIALMREGRIEQVDAPRRMYEFPTTRYAADFIGLINLFEGKVVTQTGDEVTISSETTGGDIVVHHSQPLLPGMDVCVALRPEKLVLHAQHENIPNRIEGVIREIAYLGDVSIYHVELASGYIARFTQSNILALAEQPLTWGANGKFGLAQPQLRSTHPVIHAFTSKWVKPKHAIIAAPWLWLSVFFVLPFVFVLKISFSEALLAQPPYDTIIRDIDEGLITLKINLGTYLLLFEDSLYLEALLGSLKVATISTLLCLLIGYPMAYGIASAPKAWRLPLLMLIILPFWTSFLIRIYAWIGLLKANGLINTLLLKIGIIDQPLTILYTNTAVYIGIVYNYLPFLILPLYATLVRLDRTLLEAAADLGCRPWRQFTSITLPQSMPGVLAGCMLVFIPVMGEFVIPDLLGGPDTLMLGKLMWMEFFNNKDWPLASALAVVLLIVLVVPFMLMRHFEAKAAEELA